MKEAVYTMSSGPTQGRAGVLVLNYSDKKHSIPASHPTRHTSSGATSGGTKRRMVCPLVPPWVKGSRLKDTESPQSLPRSPAPGLLSLYHTLLITAMTRPLSQRMPSSFSRATCSQRAASGLSIPGQAVRLPGL